jgi:P27 family predicted phage terminase small subunit
MMRKVTLPCPDHITGEARTEWERLTALLAERVEEIDRSILENAVVFYARWKQAEAEVAATGPVIRGPAGGAIQNPWLSIARAAARDMRACLVELGLTPRSRSKPNADQDRDALRLADFG